MSDSNLPGAIHLSFDICTGEPPSHGEDPGCQTVVNGQSENKSHLEKALEESPRPLGFELGPNQSAVGEVVDAQHPTIHGRARVRFGPNFVSDPSSSDGVELWLPTLHHLALRVGDRVLVTQPGNFDEPVITGVVDGFSRRPQRAKQAAANIELKPDESISVACSDGTLLLEISEGKQGPLVRLFQKDTQVELDGKLSLSADHIQLKASKGQVQIDASEDVVVKGETIHLN